ncbi:hypothetical protein [Deinococcus gobiensis]|uniref:Uncharacterized protein n=1 Tax=Deinococcus gobiensis (strain DSM 21396 / JCM 16679 / CGMCC 1.7299 / I-0) TaxID=745776 RepID=H8GWT7_DEIGI|nr:hypothetical protein [Deinococcus gobiensis]AFD25743.1 hypothetical protein DGo_CA1816 [Deinococcus gobiensis I-0]
MNDDHQVPGDKPGGGQKDTNDLSDIKGVQDTGMARKGQDVQDLPKAVTGEMDGSQPQNQRR